jgi:phosphate transport system substrate-binding protein
VKVLRYGRLGGVLLAGSLTLAACGSDDNSEDVTQPGATPVTTPVTQATAAASAAPAAIGCGSGTLNGEGSTAQGNAVSEWISKYQAKCSGVTINYNGTGSGAGIKQFSAAQVDWAGSDSALKPEEVDAAKSRCGGNDAWNLPLVVGPIAVAYNLSGVSNLVLDGATIAKIFSGKITRWDDQAIKDLNPSATLPGKDIKVFFRSDESGTTENFEKYLAAAGGGNYTATPSKKFSGGVGEGQAKSQGVGQAVKATDGGITYVEYSIAKDSQLGVAKVKTGGGEVELTAESAGKALAAASAEGSGNDLKLKLDYNTSAAGAYPIVLVTYEIVCSKGLDPAKTELLRGFLNYAGSAEGQNAISGIGYGVLPPDLQTKVLAAVAAVSA